MVVVSYLAEWQSSLLAEAGCQQPTGLAWWAQLLKLKQITSLYFELVVLRKYNISLKPGLYCERKSTPYTQTILHTWGAYSLPPMTIYAVVIAQMPSINTPTICRLLLWPLPAFWSSADLETWMLDCHWLIARALWVYAGFYAAYQIK